MFAFNHTQTEVGGCGGAAVDPSRFKDGNSVYSTARLEMTLYFLWRGSIVNLKMQMRKGIEKFFSILKDCFSERIDAVNFKVIIL